MLSMMVTGNNSRTSLLTIFGLKHRRSYEEFTIRLATGAVQDGNGKIGEARLKHPTSNRVRASTQKNRVATGSDFARRPGSRS